MTSDKINAGPFGDTTLTKVFVGGLAWETPNDALRNHFEKYGDILEAVIISDKITGRSKGYGFVTFSEPESAEKACKDPAPVINGRRANCNLASLGARRPRSSSIAPPRQNGPNTDVGPRSAGTVTPPPIHMQWYYPPNPAAASPYNYVHRHHHQTAVPYYGYGPATYVAATDVSYNHKSGHMGGAYMNGGSHYTHLYPGQAMVGANTVLAMYPMTMYHYHQAGPMGHTPHSYSGPMFSIPLKPTKIVPTSGRILDG